MTMNLSTGNAADDLQVIADMNTTPLIDVMLVLLVMLIITIPIQLHSVNLNLPTGKQPASAPPQVVSVEIEADGSVRWNGETLASERALNAKLATLASQSVQPELHIRPNKLVEYQTVAKVMASVQRTGLTKVGIVGNEQFL
jgi:biopolymer transport protein ExbD